MRRLIVQLLRVMPLITLVLSCVTEPEPEPDPAAAVSGQYLVRIDRPAGVGTLAAINAINLAYLKSHDTAPPRNSLGGLLSDRKSPLPAGRRA